MAAKEITVSYETEVCNLVLFEGSLDSAALNYALNARFGLGGLPFFLTLAGAPPNSAVVPLTSSLPAGTSLVLHPCERRRTLRTTTSSCGSPASSAWRTSKAAEALPPVAFAGVDADAEAEPGSPQCGSSCLRVLDRHSSHFGVNTERSRPLLEADRLQSLLPDDFTPEAAEEDSERRPSWEAQMTQISVASKQQRDATDTLVSAVVDVDRLSRLSLDLANERTLLAWTRTSLAAMRTFFPFLAISGDGLIWVSIFSSRCGMVLLCLLAGVLGILRYVQVKRITFAPVSGSVRFGRLTIHWFTSFLFLACSVMVASTFAVSVQK